MTEEVDILRKKPPFTPREEVKFRKADRESILRQIVAFKVRLASEEYRNVLGDLVAFTGMEPEEVCFRTAKKFAQCYGARGWFNEEFDYFDPKTPADYAWFYRAAQTYVFSNARKRWWGFINQLSREDQPVLDFGAGIGQNVLELRYRGFEEAWYFELSSLQREFHAFRMQRHGFEPLIITPYRNNRFEPIACIEQEFGGVILQDVLEHVPDYERILEHLSHCVRRDGKLIEHSPFATKQKRRGVFPHMHLEDKAGLKKAMAEHGFQLEKVFPQDGKQKSEVRLWKKT